MEDEIRVEAEPGRRRRKVYVKRGDEIIHADIIDPADAKQRAQFANAVQTKLPVVQAEDIDRSLLLLISTNQPEPGPCRELDLSQIVRPEQFFTKQVSGFAIPVILDFGGGPVPRWLLHLRWDDGHRDVIQLDKNVCMPDGYQLWLHPIPGPPSLPVLTQWSIQSRQAWQRGEIAIDPVQLFCRLCERIVHFLDLREDTAKGTTATIALWSMLTYVYQAWDAVPYLDIGGPMHSGKSRLLDVLARMVFRPLNSSNLTGPTLFRTLHDRGGVLLYDEAEGLRASTPEAGELLSMLLAGYRRSGTATRLETVGDSYGTISFDVFGPKALAGIAGLPPTLASRSIPVTMFRASPDSEKPKRRIDERAAEWQCLRDDLHVLALENGQSWLELAQRTEVCPKAINGRAYELWQPLLALAFWIESHGAHGLLELLQRHAVQTIEAAKDDSNPEADEILLVILTEALKEGRIVTPGDILKAAQDREPNIFGQPNSAGPRWQSSGVSRRLRSYGLKTKKSNGKRTYRDVTLLQLSKVQQHYCVDLDIAWPGQESVPPVPACP